MTLVANNETELDYVLEDQVGYLLRLASQRHSVIFQKHAIENMTPTQFSTLVRVAEIGEVSQNHLGRLAAMDVATIKGVVDRLRAKNLIMSRPDKIDKRRTVISLTEHGSALIVDLRSTGLLITRETLAPLSTKEQVTLVALLRKIS
ncbi:MAG: DNA-binding MarR family transcriptional regulator [Candidatus Azotimanducaceae bacterium]|jgi:DNA-binding MarR family transcriptional regulator